jgi:predicted  nucleic acid-binding Zn ribbon protein
MKSNTEMARTAFRYCGGIAALFILFTGKLNAQQTKTEEKPAMQVIYLRDESNYLVFKVA